MDIPNRETNAMPQSVRALVHNVLRSYTLKSPQQLVSLYASTYSSNAAFIDPLVKASPAREARLQFLALQRIFASITAEASEPVVEDAGGGTLDVSVDTRWKYEWRRDGALSRRLLPEATIIDGTVHLQVEKASEKVLVHTDVWHSPKVPALPTPLRVLNAWATNAVCRMLGWERELLEEDRRLKEE